MKGSRLTAECACGFLVYGPTAWALAACEKHRCPIVKNRACNHLWPRWTLCGCR